MQIESKLHLASTETSSCNSFAHDAWLCGIRDCVRQRHLEDDSCEQSSIILTILRFLAKAS